MNICILDNDTLEGELQARYTSFGAMFVRLFQNAGANWSMDVFNTPLGQYPASYDAYDAVVLTGSASDSFSPEPWAVELRSQVTALLAAKKKMLGICFGHQLIALCLGVRVGRAPQGWAEGRMVYQWHRPDLPLSQGRTEVALLASHQDQVFALPPGASLVASSNFCPVAAYTIGNHVFCVQAHPEFDTHFSATLLEKHSAHFDETTRRERLLALQLGHEGDFIARVMVAFVAQA